MRNRSVTVFKIASTALASATAFAMSTATVFAMGGRSGRPGEYGNHGGNGGHGGGSSNLSTSGGSVPGGEASVPGNVSSVPEIDASTGLLAMAAVLAIVAFMRERNRRQNA
jgi:hypothetical protein